MSVYDPNGHARSGSHAGVCLKYLQFKRCHGSKLEQGSRERERHRGGWMRSSNNKILTTHAGSLSRPPNLIALSRARAVGENEDKAAYATCLTGAVADVVRKQRALGIDIPDDGEFGKPVAGSYDYGAWWNYAFARMSVCQSPRLAEIQRILSRSGIER